MRTLTQPAGGLQLPAAGENYSLAFAFRWLDDLSAHHAARVAASLGGDESRILEIGYGLANPTFSRALRHSKPIKHNSIILPCRDAKGEIVALHDHQMRWLTAPAVHIANPLRARLAGIELCDTTAQADSIAAIENVCVIARNGCDDRAVQSAVLSVLSIKETAVARRVVASWLRHKQTHAPERRAA